jgi:hypothetical protein
MQKHQQQQSSQHRPVRGVMTAAGFAAQQNAALKRPAPGRQRSRRPPSKQPRLEAALVVPKAVIGGVRCRVCAQLSPLTEAIKGKSEIVEALKFVLHLHLDDDEDPSYPDAICKRCVSHLVPTP